MTRRQRYQAFDIYARLPFVLASTETDQKMLQGCQRCSVAMETGARVLPVTKVITKSSAEVCTNIMGWI